MQTIFQSNVEDAYRRFLQLVADGRNMSVAEVDAIAQGRVWTGEQALGLGLVDSLGDLDQAVNAAAQLAGLNEWQSVYLHRELSPGEQFLIQMIDTMGTAQIQAAVQNGLGLAAGVAGGTSVDSLWGAALSALPPALRQHWQAMLDIVLPGDRGYDRLRMIMVCDTCLGAY
jgi:protease-4